MSENKTTVQGSPDIGQVDGVEVEFYSSPIIFSKSTNLGQDSKGKDKLTILLDEAQTDMLAEAVNYVKSLGKRIKLQMHYTADNSFLFVKEVQPKGATFTKKTGGGSSSFRPATGGADIKAKIAGMKKQA